MSSFGLSVRCSVRSCWFAVLALCLAAGCGGGGGGEEVVTSEVAGKVTVGGKPLTQGRINFVSPEKGVGAGGDLGPEGAYTLEGPLPVGQYKVFITFNLAPSQIGTPAEEILKSIPEKYQSQEASDLSATVEQDRAAYDFELQKLPAAGIAGGFELRCFPGRLIDRLPARGTARGEPPAAATRRVQPGQYRRCSVTVEVTVEELIEAASQAARDAGRILTEWAGKFTVREKGRADLVTEADHAAQAAIHELLRGRFPEHGFLGEEGLEEPASGGSGYRWIIDPLDGTSNYVHGFPFFAVSIGVEFQGELTAGVVYDPTRDELFAAATGRGTTLNGRSVETSGVEKLDQAMLMASLPVGTRADNPAIARFLRVLPHAQTVQRSGSAALNLSYVACGRIDGFWSSSLKPWDMAAGAVLVREAGGSVSGMEGGRFAVDRPNLLAAASSSLQQQLVELLPDAAVPAG